MKEVIDSLFSPGGENILLLSHMREVKALIEITKEGIGEFKKMR
jgi:hypothetical protein